MELPNDDRNEGADHAGPLAQVLARLSTDKTGSVVFDLDSTLIDNRPRQAAILREYGSTWALDSFAQVQPSHFETWDLSSALSRAGVPAPLVAQHREAVRAFWQARFFTSDYCRFDVEVAGAAAFASRVAALGRVIYLTGRPPEMRAGTVASMARLGLPMPGESLGGLPTELLLKPDPALHDDDWKVRAVRAAEALGPVVAAFDNEPTHINGYRSAWPDAICVRLATDHSGRPVQLLPRVLEIPHFSI